MKANGSTQYYVKGTGHMTIFAARGHARTMDFHEGDVGYIEALHAASH